MVTNASEVVPAGDPPGGRRGRSTSSKAEDEARRGAHGATAHVPPRRFASDGATQQGRGACLCCCGLVLAPCLYLHPRAVLPAQVDMALLDSRAAFVVWVYDSVAEVVIAMTAQSIDCQPIVSADDKGVGLLSFAEFQARVWSELVAIDKADSGAGTSGGEPPKYNAEEQAKVTTGPPVLLFSRSPVEELTHVAYKVRRAVCVSQREASPCTDSYTSCVRACVRTCVRVSVCAPACVCACAHLRVRVLVLNSERSTHGNVRARMLNWHRGGMLSQPRNMTLHVNVPM